MYRELHIAAPYAEFTTTKFGTFDRASIFLLCCAVEWNRLSSISFVTVDDTHFIYVASNRIYTGREKI